MAHSSGGTEKRMFQQITRHFVTSDFTKWTRFVTVGG
jgi:hypothetical protein